jgi:hypothetical protein
MNNADSFINSDTFHTSIDEACANDIPGVPWMPGIAFRNHQGTVNISGNAAITNKHARKDFNFLGLKINGGFSIVGCTFGRLVFADTHITGEFRIVDSTIGEVVLGDEHFIRNELFLGSRTTWKNSTISIVRVGLMPQPVTVLVEGKVTIGIASMFCCQRPVLVEPVQGGLIIHGSDPKQLPN